MPEYKISVEWPSPLKFDVRDGIAYEYAKIKVKVEGLDEPWDYKMTISFDNAVKKDECIFIDESFRIELYGFDKWGSTEGLIYVIPLKPGKHDISFDVCIYYTPYAGYIEKVGCEHFTGTLEFYETDKHSKPKKHKGKKSKRGGSEHDEDNRLYKITVYVDNCSSEGGGTIYLLEGGKWTPIAKWGLAAHRSCCEPTEIVLPAGRYTLRANCGIYKHITVPDETEIHLYAIGCYGTTDDIDSYKKYGLCMMVVGGKRTLFGLDNTAYVYSTPTTLFIEPGEHTIYTPDGRKIKVHAMPSKEIYISL